MAATLRCVFGLRPSGFHSVVPCLTVSAGVWQYRQISSDDFRDPDKKEKPHPETPQFPMEHTLDPPKGKIYDKKPFKMQLKAGKDYHWCACGTSKNQPLCDGSHKALWGTSENKTGYKWRPLRFQVEKDKAYWLCNCKQTSKAPFCDGTHKQPHIQAAVK
ncbi:uncharacterized protein LOC143293415 isoform X1 [Babylonia areolata]|uniref:uncharacterized protein LOC143293415 isoform X1 n=1 Tax=Babylonia areolata TaxID=304850 RepID=UPI003FD4CA84